MKFNNNPKVDRESLRALPSDHAPGRVHVMNNRLIDPMNLRDFPKNIEKRQLIMANNAPIDIEIFKLLPSELLDDPELEDESVDGFIYAMRADAYPDAFKIGGAIDPFDRCKTFNTADPRRTFEVIYMERVPSYIKIEKRVHRLLSRYVVLAGHEWFTCDLRIIKNAVSDIIEEFITALQAMSPDVIRPYPTVR